MPPSPLHRCALGLLAIVGFGCPEPGELPPDGERPGLEIERQEPGPRLDHRIDWSLGRRDVVVVDDDDSALSDDDDSTPEDLALPALAPLDNACPATASATAFVDVSACAGVDVQHAMDGNETWYLTGQAFGDVDGDGRLDLFLSSQSGENRLLVQGDEGSFTVVPDAGVQGIPAGGASFVDYDNDGDPDLYLSSRGPAALLVNDGGVFSAPELGCGSDGLGSGSAWGDYDGDGVLDVYATNYYCGTCEWFGEEAIPRASDHLYARGAEPTFTEQTALLGEWEVAGFGFSAVWADFDNDGDLDLMVVNDKGTDGDPQPGWTMNRNLLWRNDGPGCGGHCFAEVGQDVGADLRIDSMCLAVADYDNDGDLDAFMTQTGTPKLLQNQGDGSFIDVSLAAGLTDWFVGWGCAFFDYDNDGWLDVFAAAENETDRLFRGSADGTFESILDSGATDEEETHGLATGDYDFDGAVDLLKGQPASTYQLIRNLAPDPSHNWFGVRLIGAGPGGTDAVGARVYATDTTGRTQMREVKIGSSIGSGNDTGLHFGLGEALPINVWVRWLDGTEQPIAPPLNSWSVAQRSAP